MHPFISQDMARQINEERLANALKRYSWRSQDDTTSRPQQLRPRDADVIEVLFGAQCEIEDAIA